jgi:large subunit ribosomal protein L23
MPSTKLIHPIITEKTLRLAEASQFSFYVTPQATKASIKKTVEDLFNVTVLKVRVANISGKTRRSGKKGLSSRAPDRKKAVITLKSGDTIEYFQLPDKKAKSKTKAKLATKKPAKSQTEKPQKRGLFGLRRQPKVQEKSAATQMRGE